MKATSEQVEELNTLFKQSMTLHINCRELSRFLSEIFGHSVVITEASDGTSHKVTISETTSFSSEELVEIEELMKKGSFEYWRLWQVFGWLLNNGYIKPGVFVIDFNW